MTDFPTALRALMDERKLTQSALAQASGLRQGSISDWLAGRHEPSLSALDALAGALGVSLDTLAGRAKKRSKAS